MFFMLLISFFILNVAIETAPLQPLGKIKKHNASVPVRPNVLLHGYKRKIIKKETPINSLALSANVNAGCEIKCPNGMIARTEVNCEGFLYKVIDRAIKKACFAKYDAMVTDAASQRDANYWKASWLKVESTPGFGCTAVLGKSYSTRQHIGCRLHDICYETFRHWSDSGTSDVPKPGGWWIFGADNDVKGECDSAQWDNQEALGASNNLIRATHWLGFSNGAFRDSWAEAKVFYESNSWDSYCGDSCQRCADFCKRILSWGTYFGY